MIVQFKHFDDLSINELYGIMQLREAVFTMEQGCKEEDLDGLDLKAQHVFIEVEQKVIACGRFFEPRQENNRTLSFGRLVVAKKHRGKGYGKKIFEAFLEYADKKHPRCDILMSSQCYVKDFYKQYGFQEVGETYMEADILHIKMHILK